MLSYSRFFATAADNALNFGLVLLIVQETDLAIMSSLLVLALVVPSTVVGILAGHAADTLPKRPLIFLGNLARALICIWFVREGGGVLSFYVTAIALACAGEFVGAASGALRPALVERDELARANALNQAIGSAAQFAGLALLAPLVLRLFDSPEALFVITALMYVTAGVAAVLIGGQRRSQPESVGDAETPSGLLAGWRVLRSDPAISQAAIELTLISLTLIILGGLVPKFISDTLGLPVDVGAAILVPGALGVALGLRVAGFLSHRVAHALLSTIGFVLFVVMLLALTFVNQEFSFLTGYALFAWLDHVNIGSFDGAGVLAVFIMVPLGFAFATVTVSGQTVLNDLVPLHLQGRANATRGAIAALISTLPVLGAGLLADLVGVTTVMAIVSALIGVAALNNFRPSRTRVTPPALSESH